MNKRERERIVLVQCTHPYIISILGQQTAYSWDIQATVVFNKNDSNTRRQHETQERKRPICLGLIILNHWNWGELLCWGKNNWGVKFSFYKHNPTKFGIGWCCFFLYKLVEWSPLLLFCENRLFSQRCANCSCVFRILVHQIRELDAVLCDAMLFLLSILDITAIVHSASCPTRGTHRCCVMTSYATYRYYSNSYTGQWKYAGYLVVAFLYYQLST